MPQRGRSASSSSVSGGTSVEGCERKRGRRRGKCDEEEDIDMDPDIEVGRGEPSG